MLDFAKFFLNFSLCFAVGAVVITLSSILLSLIITSLCTIYSNITSTLLNRKASKALQAAVMKKVNDASFDEVMSVFNKEAK